MAGDLVIEHGIVAYQWDETRQHPQNVLHFVGYPEAPDEEEMDRMLRELATDPCFGLVGIPFCLKRATPEQVAFYMADLPDEIYFEEEDDFG